jgi:hypothetical protein
MAISVAPLTTTVMNSVKVSHAGIASGINNAVSRTAGLLSIAVLGVVMFQSFGGCLNQRLDLSGISADVRQTISSETRKLAAMEIPSADSATYALLKQIISECFVSGFRRVMAIGVALALASSLTALLMLRKARS